MHLNGGYLEEDSQNDMSDDGYDNYGYYYSEDNSGEYSSENEPYPYYDSNEGSYSEALFSEDVHAQMLAQQ